MASLQEWVEAAQLEMRRGHAHGAFEEALHPRGRDGKFASGHGGATRPKLTLAGLAAALPAGAGDRGSQVSRPKIDYTRVGPKNKPKVAGGKHGPPVLSPAAYQALRPARQQSFTLRDRSLRSLGDSDDARVLADTLARWQDGGGVKRLRTKIDVMANGGDVDAKTRQRAETLLNAIEHAPPSMAPSTLHRGMALSGSPEKIAAKYAPGSTVNLLPSSFTSDPAMADEFARPVGSRRTRVLMQLTGEKRALPIQNLSKSNQFFREKEWVTAGSFEIVGTKVMPDGTVVLKIKQKETL